MHFMIINSKRHGWFSVRGGRVAGQGVGPAAEGSIATSDWHERNIEQNAFCGPHSRPTFVHARSDR